MCDKEKEYLQLEVSILKNKIAVLENIIDKTISGDVFQVSYYGYFIPTKEEFSKFYGIRNWNDEVEKRYKNFIDGRIDVIRKERYTTIADGVVT